MEMVQCIPTRALSRARGLSMRTHLTAVELAGLDARAHVPFGQHQDTELGADLKALGLWERDWELVSQ